MSKNSKAKFSVQPLDLTRLSEACQVINKTSLPGWKTQGLSDETIKMLTDRNTEQYFADKAQEGYFYLAIESQTDKIVGIIGLRKNEDSPLPNRLSTFFVDPDYQHKGIGRLLYQAIETKARELGCQKMVVNSSPYGEPIYKHFGFSKIRIDWKDYDNGDRYYNVWMEKELS